MQKGGYGTSIACAAEPDGAFTPVPGSQPRFLQRDVLAISAALLRSYSEQDEFAPAACAGGGVLSHGSLSHPGGGGAGLRRGDNSGGANRSPAARR